MTPYNASLKRRLNLIRKEPIFRQQSGELQKLGNLWAAQESDLAIKTSLRDIDLTVWDESENILRDFAQDLEYAPYNIEAFLSQIAEKGRESNLEIQLPSMVAALTVVRICAGGREVREKYNGLLRAIIHSQKLPAKRFDYFNECCAFFDLNKFDPATGEETVYRRGDPMERVKDTEEEKTEARIETLLGQILDATGGWNRKDAFGDYWSQWRELWRCLLEQDEQGEFFETLSKKCPNSSANTTTINMTLVCNVAGLLKRHLESKRLMLITDTKLANLIHNVWSSSQCHKEFPLNTMLKGQEETIKGWLKANVLS